jgi:O-acetyl-ADP-ribose deacetylase (regulator of RNase III)
VAADPRIRLVEGDLTRFAADAVVNAANSGLHGGGGVDGAIHRAGGPAIMADLERRYGPGRHCPTGQAVVSDAGALPARVVIHAVGPVWRGGGAGEPDLLASAYRVSLDLAAAEQARTVAFPAISCGVFGYPLAAAAEVAIEAVRSWLDANPDGPVEEVTWILRSDDVMAAFQAALARA